MFTYVEILNQGTGETQRLEFPSRVAIKDLPINQPLNGTELYILLETSKTRSFSRIGGIMESVMPCWDVGAGDFPYEKGAYEKYIGLPLKVVTKERDILGALAAKFSFYNSQKKLYSDLKKAMNDINPRGKYTITAANIREDELKEAS